MKGFHNATHRTTIPPACRKIQHGSNCWHATGCCKL